MLGLGAHLVHEPGALYRQGEAGVVLDVGVIISWPPCSKPAISVGSSMARAA